MREEFLTVCLNLQLKLSTEIWSVFSHPVVSQLTHRMPQRTCKNKSYLLCIRVSFSAKCWCLVLCITLY